MNIQLPVVLWTVICFLLLMLILKNLLFKPVFAVLDQRKKKLEQAQKKQEAIDAVIKEHEARLALFEEDAKIQRENYIKSELKLIKIKSRTELEEAKNGRAARLDEARKNAEAEKEAIRSSFRESSDEIVKAFAKRLIEN